MLPKQTEKTKDPKKMGKVGLDYVLVGSFLLPDAHKVLCMCKSASATK